MPHEAVLYPVVRHRQRKIDQGLRGVFEGRGYAGAENRNHEKSAGAEVVPCLVGLLVGRDGSVCDQRDGVLILMKVGVDVGFGVGVEGVEGAGEGEVVDSRRRIVLNSGMTPHTSPVWRTWR
jgi:hypothetical protein